MYVNWTFRPQWDANQARALINVTLSTNTKTITTTKTITASTTIIDITVTTVVAVSQSNLDFTHHQLCTSGRNIILTHKGWNGTCFFSVGGTLSTVMVQQVV